MEFRKKSVMERSGLDDLIFHPSRSDFEEGVKKFWEGVLEALNRVPNLGVKK